MDKGPGLVFGVSKIRIQVIVTKIETYMMKSSCIYQCYSLLLILSYYHNILVSRGIVELHGGRISVQSAGEGAGATFIVDIPLQKSDNITRNQDQTLSIQTQLSTSAIQRVGYAPVTSSRVHPTHNIYTIESTSMSPRRMSALRFLVVDDATSNRKMLCRLLQSDHYIAYEASDGLEALSIVKESINTKNNTNDNEMESNKQFDVILMDFVMPNMDGPTATKAIRDLGYNGVIIGVTGHAMPADIELFLSQGADQVMTKPVHMPTLTSAIEGMYVDCKSLFLVTGTVSCHSNIFICFVQI